MNSKRQTIWLVSMLSLMVILSAYYLFTEDVTPPQSGNKQQSADAAKASGHLASDVQVNIVDPGTSAADESSAMEISDSLSPDDESVLNEYTSLKGREYFDHLQRLREEKFDSESERLHAVVADTKNHTQDEAQSATEQLALLDDEDSRITSLEVKLQQDFENAVVTPEDMHYRVIVQAPELNKKQAVQIIELAVKELKVTPDRLTVEYVE